MEAVFRGKVNWRLGRECWPSRWFIFITNTRWVQDFCWWQTLFLGQKCDEEAGGQKLLHVYLQDFFSSYKLPKTVTVTALLLFGHVTLICGTFLFIKLSEGPVQSSDCMTPPPYAQLAHPFTLVQFPSTAPLILSDEFHIQKLLKCYIKSLILF